MRTARTSAPDQKSSCFRVIENTGGGFLFRQTSDIDGHDHSLFVLDVAEIAPVTEAAIGGRLPRGFCVKRLTDLPMLWSEQWRALGLQAPIQLQAEPS